MPRADKNIVLTQEQYDGLIQRLDDLSKGQAEIKLELASRKDIDETVSKDHELLLGNGKPGFVAIRDKVLGWETKINAITLLVLGDVVIRLVFFAFSIPSPK